MPDETLKKGSAPTHTLADIAVEVKIPLPEVYISMSVPTDFFKPDLRISQPHKPGATSHS